MLYRSRAATAPQEPASAPDGTLQLEPLRPNPTREGAEFAYRLDEPSEISLAVYAADGRFLREINRTHERAGRYTLAWDGADRHGSQVPSGTYFFEFTAWGAASHAMVACAATAAPAAVPTSSGATSNCWWLPP